MSAVDLTRQLLAHAKAAGYEHATYQVNNGPIEHNWRIQGREHEVSLCDGFLTYKRHGALLLTALVNSPEQVADLLAAVGVVPVELTTGYDAGQRAEIERLRAELDEVDAENAVLTNDVIALKTALERAEAVTR